MYVDDTIIFSNNPDEQMRHFREVMNVLRDADIALKLKKCELFTNAVKCLGQFIFSGWILIEKARGKSLVDCGITNSSYRPVSSLHVDLGYRKLQMGLT